MSRLTKPVEIHVVGFNEYIPLKNFEEAIDKLGKIEDVEEKLGMSILALFDILKSRTIFVKHYRGIEELDYCLSYDNNGKEWFMDTPYYKKFYIKEYGKTWALTKEELESEEEEEE